MTKSDNKLTLIRINFSMKAFNSLKSTEFESLNKRDQDFFHFEQSFGKLHQLKHFIIVSMLGNPIKNLEASRLLQLYFFDNIFNHDKNNKIQKHSKLTKKAIETLINIIFTLEREEHKNRVRHYIEQMNVRLE